MSAEYLIRLPWPPAKASANSSHQGDWRGKAKARASYKATCAMECIAQGVRRMGANGDIPVTVTYHPPRNSRIDWDNMAGRTKQGFDAISEAIGIDDGRWWPVTSEKGAKVSGGCVLVQIKQGISGE